MSPCKNCKKMIASRENHPGHPIFDGSFTMHSTMKNRQFFFGLVLWSASVALLVPACKSSSERTSTLLTEDASEVAGNRVVYDPTQPPVPTANGIYALTPRRFDDTISLPTLLADQYAKSGDSDLIQKYNKMIESVTGVQISLGDLANKLGEPGKITDLLQVPMPLLKTGRDAVIATRAKDTKAPQLWL